MDRYKETFETWNKVAKLYQDSFMNLELYNDTYDDFCSAVSKADASILEIGCGPGNITKYLSNKRADFNIEGIDISPNMVALAKSNNLTHHFSVMDSREIDQLQLKYDGIVIGFCIPYLSEKDCVKLIRDCSKLLNPKGVIYISFVEGESEQSGYQSGSTGDRTYFYYHRLDFLKDELNENAFHNTKVMYKNFRKKDGTIETHTIVLATN